MNSTDTNSRGRGSGGMSPQFTKAVRTELAAIGTRQSRLRRQQRRTRALLIAVGAVIIVGATTGAAIAVNRPPGTTTVTPLGGAITRATHTGSATLDLGPVPARAGAVIIRLACLNRQGSVSFAGTPQDPGSPATIDTFYCRPGRDSWQVDDGALPRAGQTTIDVTADPGTRWTITAQYASSVTSAWGVNAHKQTYGLCDPNGCPDLIGVQVINGQEGYVLAREWDAVIGSGYLNVYKPDGTTVIGKFTIGTPGN